MNFRSERLPKKPNCNRKTTKLGIEQLESRLMNSIDSLSSNLQLLSSPGLFGTTQIVLNTPPSVARPLSLSSGTAVSGRTASFSVLGADNAGESTLKYNWHVTDVPSGGTISFAANRTNAAKNNSLTFNKPGEYQVRVTIVDAQGLTSTTSLNFNVEQTLTRLVVKTPEGRTVTPSVAINTSESRQSLTIQGLDQFGVAMNSQPSVNWQSVGAPTGGSAILTPDGNSISAGFNRAGTYALRAQSGFILANVKINVTQTTNSIDLLTLDGAPINPDTPIDVASANQRLTVRANDQFGNSMVLSPRVTWSTLSAPSGGAATVSIVSGVATVTFKREGSYVLRAQAGNASHSVSFQVSQVLTKVVAVLPNNRQVSSGSTVSVAGQNVTLSARGFDQFGKLLPTQPDFVWTSVAALAGTSANVVQSGNDADLTFQRAGVYTFRATTGTSTLNITINVLQTVTSLTVTPGTASLQTSENQQFRYQTADQFGHVITNQPAGIWTTTGGTITSGGVLSSGTRAGTFTVTAKIGTVSGTASITVIAPTLQSTLRNAALASLVSSLYSDSQLSRTEMIQVLRSAGGDGVVDATELEDLRFIASTSSFFAMPGYVRELAKDVLNSNSANRTFKGQAAGNLAAGSSSTLLNNLVDKWFLGSDEPVLSGSGLSYQTAVGNLFNGTPSRNDARQGQLGDCYFIASLVSLADHNPDSVRNLFIDNSDGTYTVRFYAGALGSFSNNGLVSSGFISGAGTADYVTVNRRLPTNANGRLEYSGYGLSIASSATTLWIALAEKAYAQWNETGNEGRDGTNRYSSIEGGWMSNVNAQVLGYNSTNYAFSNTPKQSLVNAVSSGKSVTLGTLQNASAGGLVGGHAYTVVGYNASTDTFTLHNPWGTWQPSQLTWSQLQSSCSMFTVANPSGSVAISLASVRSSTIETFVGNWTTVVAAQVVAFTDTIREFEETTTREPLFAILGSSLEGESNLSSLALIEVTPQGDRDIAENPDIRLENPLAANLVDLAMIQLNLNAI